MFQRFSGPSHYKYVYIYYYYYPDEGKYDAGGKMGGGLKTYIKYNIYIFIMTT